MNNLIISEYGEEVYQFVSRHTSIDNSTLIISTTNRFNIDQQSLSSFKSIVNLHRINDIRWINKFFESVNNKLPLDGIFIGCAETYTTRVKKHLKRYGSFLGKLVISVDFIYKRVIPKLPFVKKIYFTLTKGRGRVLSKAETLGRLVSCGFEILDHAEINNLLYFSTKKISIPAYDPTPSYGPIFKMKRIGKNEKIIYVYKFRTMHPFAEYLQAYILKVNGYSEIGKLANDFRLTKWGKFLRKYWLDELPQLINVIKGEMRIVGVRPLSQINYNEYPIELKEKRIKYKPGCFPPYVALLMQNPEDGLKAEQIYLTEKEKHPFKTDIKYLCKSIYNILSNKIRSA